MSSAMTGGRTLCATPLEAAHAPYGKDSAGDAYSKRIFGP